VELALELPDGKARQFGQFGDVEALGQVVLDELGGGLDLQEGLQDGLRAFITTDRPADPARPAVDVEDRQLGRLVPDVLADFVGEELDDPG